MVEKKRDLSIDILKFFAVLLITNSHMETLYPRFAALATGGGNWRCLILLLFRLHPFPGTAAKV